MERNGSTKNNCLPLHIQGDMPSLFRKFDSNGNGELTMDEFCDACPNFNSSIAIGNRGLLGSIA